MLNLALTTIMYHYIRSPLLQDPKMLLTAHQVNCLVRSITLTVNFAFSSRILIERSLGQHAR